MRVGASEAAVYDQLVSEFPTIRVVVCLPDGAAVAAWVGRDVAQLTGYSVAELEADPDLWLDIVHPADRERVRDACRRLAEGAHTREEYRVYRRDGQMRWVADMGAASSVSDDGLMSSIRCVTDITSTRAVGQIDVDFKELVEETPVGVTVRDTTGRLLYCNEAAARIYLADSRDELLGTRVEDIVHPEFGREFREHIFPALLEGEWSGERQLKRKDGSVVHLRAAASPFRDREGRIAGVYSILSDITDLKNTEAALRTSQDRLTAVQDALPANLAVVDEQGTIVSTNERWRRFAQANGDPGLKHTCEGVNYLDVCRRAQGRSAEGALGALEGLVALLRGEIGELEMEYPCHSPTAPHWFVMRAGRIEGRRGAVVAHIDITRRKLAEQALRESEGKYRSLVENLDAVVFRIDRDLQPLAMAGHPERLVGYTADEILRHPSLMRESVHPEDMTKLWEQLARSEAMRAAQPVEIRLRHRTGQVKWTQATITPVFDEGGKLLYFDGICLDITDRRLAEEARRQAEAKYRDVVESLDAVIFRVDPRGIPIALYGNVAEISGFTITELMQDPKLWMNCVHPDDLPGLSRYYEEIAATGERRVIEMRLVRRSAEVRWIRTHVAPRYNEDGELLHFDGVGLDITESVEAKQREAKRTARMRALTQLSQAFATTLDAQEILDMATKQVCTTLDCPCLAVTMTPDANHVQRVSICCPGHCEIEHLDGLARGAPMTVEQLFGRRGVRPGLVKDLARLSPLAAMFVECAKQSGAGPLGPAVVVPVASGPDAVGIMVAARPRGQQIDQEDSWFVYEVASHASATLANAALYRQKATIAEHLQRGLIPVEPVIDGLDIATLYAPAPGDAQVGGDFFDVLRLGGGRVGVVVGDVSGKGLEAAIHTAEAKYMLRAFVHTEDDPTLAIDRLNSALFEYLPDEMFITMVYLVIDPARHSLTCVNAGHEVCVVRSREDMSLRELAPTGHMLGVARGIPYRAVEVQFAPGDDLVCYTDGITEVRSNGDRFGYDRLAQAIQDAPPADSRAVLESIVRVVRGFGASRQTDDQVVVVARLLA